MKDERSDQQAKRPENGKEETDSAGEGMASGDLFGVDEREGTERNEAKADEGVVGPEKLAEKRRERLEVAAHLNDGRHEGPRAQKRKMSDTGELKEESQFHNACTAFKKGRMTF